VVTPVRDGSHAAVQTRADPALARARRWHRLLDEGRYASITEMAARRESSAATPRVDCGYAAKTKDMIANRVIHLFPPAG
jgi:hypothetical protein